MVRMSFIDALNILEKRNLEVMGTGDKEQKYMLFERSHDGFLESRHSFKNGYEVVRFAKYCDANPTILTESLITDLTEGKVNDWWNEKTKADKANYFRELAKSKKEENNDSDNN